MQSIWYALLLGLFLMEPGSASGGLRADIFINSLPMGSIHIEGDSGSGQMYSDELLLGSYEASRQYRQTYLVFPSQDAEQFLDAPEASVDASMEAAESLKVDDVSPQDDGSRPLYASSGQAPLALDLSPVLAGLPRLAEGRVVSLPPNGYPEPMPQDWTLRLDRGRLSISSAAAGIVVILYQD